MYAYRLVSKVPYPVSAYVCRYNHHIKIILSVTEFRIVKRFNNHLFAINQSKNMEFPICVIFNRVFKLESSETKIEQIMFTNYILGPTFSLPCKFWLLNKIFVYPFCL